MNTDRFQNKFVLICDLMLTLPNRILLRIILWYIWFPGKVKNDKRIFYSGLKNFRNYLALKI